MPPAETGDSWVMLSHDLRGKECTGCVGGVQGQGEEDIACGGNSVVPREDGQFSSSAG